MNKLFQSIRWSILECHKNTILYLNHNRRKTALVAIALFIIISAFYTTIFRSPAGFPSGNTITIKEGSTLSDVANQFKDKNIVRSSVWLRNLAILLNGDKGVLSGDYFFDKPENIFSVARRITSGDFDLNLIEVVIPEGATNYEIGRILESKSDSFDREEFMVLVNGKEGYLFPDTYLFLPNVRAKEVARELNNNFIEKITEIDDKIRASGIPIDEVITMASILEKEARTTESRRIIAGILWERIRIDMPLQVDAVFVYANGKNSFTLTTKDLRDDHPYNTYTNKGLPPTPIANPGLDSILAAINPIESNYLFFLSDRRGNMHYSETFDEHVRKKNIYLN